MFLMDRFFNGAFLTFGLEVIAFAERDQVCRIQWKKKQLESTISSFPAAIYQIVFIRGSFYTKKRMDYDCFPQLFYKPKYIRKTYSKTLFNALPSNVYDNFLVKSFSTAKIWFACEENNKNEEIFSKNSQSLIFLIFTVNWCNINSLSLSHNFYHPKLHIIRLLSS